MYSPRPPQPFNHSYPVYEVMKSLLKSYVLENILGEGHYGVVYSGRRISDNKSVAIKFLLSSKTTTDKIPSEITFSERCMDVDGVIEMYEWRQGHYIANGKSANYVMILERFGTQDLFDYITVRNERDRPLNVRESFHIFVQLVGIWKNLYDVGVCHNDLKDENVLISGNKVKLIDFSCATEKGDPNTFDGTRCYRPPEFVTKKSFAVEPADVWAFGILLYDLIMGDIPFETTREIVAGKLNFYDLDCSESKRIIRWCLNSTASERPSITALLTESERVLTKMRTKKTINF